MTNQRHYATLADLANATEGALHGGGQPRAGVLLVEHVDAVDGRAAGRGALVAQLGGVFARLEEAGGGRLQRLRRQLHRHVLRQAHLEATVGEGADEVVHKGQAVAAQGAGRVHGRLGDELDLSEGGEQVAHDGGALLRVRLGVDGAQPQAVGD
ncbi:hypothetical protein TYRP_018631 [Tyrophagus putrescentiae]|nr:hypothetical protein TYRP_018631 [Tyrophagus putrescentiae]